MRRSRRQDDSIGTWLLEFRSSERRPQGLVIWVYTTEVVALAVTVIDRGRNR